MSAPSVDRRPIHENLERARSSLQTLVSQATRADLRRPSAGTRWTNRQLLFHMLFGYLIVQRLLSLVRAFGHLPEGVDRRFAQALNVGTRPFHAVNYLGSCGGALVFHDHRLTVGMDRVIASLHRRLDGETDEALETCMHFPVRWDPFFRDQMSLADVYRFGTEHFDFHATQLTLGRPRS